MRMPGSIVMQVTLKLDHETVYSHQYKIGHQHFAKMKQDLDLAYNDIKSRLIMEVTDASEGKTRHAEPSIIKP